MVAVGLAQITFNSSATALTGKREGPFYHCMLKSRMHVQVVQERAAHCSSEDREWVGGGEI